jgi:hypothetical protein
MAMVSRVLMTLWNKDVIPVILHDRAIVIMAMRTMTSNPRLNKRTILAMFLVLTKNFHMILPNITIPSQATPSQANIMVMGSTKGDVDVHSHVVPIATPMMT